MVTLDIDNVLRDSFAAQCLRAYLECSPEIQESIRELVVLLSSEDLDDDERFRAVNTIGECLFPALDSAGRIGVDLESLGESEPEIAAADAALAEEERTFADRLSTVMAQKEVTQTELASRIGVKQPAISMMLNRQCRPQARTIHKLAEALGVEPSVLWPDVDR